ncbi:MAG: hypothetical protein AAB538_02460 [Patescibacteria group bacterium]
MSGKQDELPGNVEFKEAVLPELLGRENRTQLDHLKAIFSPETVTNAWTDTKDIIGGLGKLLGTGFKELVYKPVTGQVEGSIPEHYYETGKKIVGAVPEMAKAAVKDLSEWRDPLKRIDEHPLYALMDVMAAATLPGAAARTALRSSAVAGSKVAPALERVGKFSYRGAASKKLAEKSPAYSTYLAHRADIKDLREINKITSRFHLQATAKDVELLKKVKSSMSDEEFNQLPDLIEGRVPFYKQEGETWVRNPAVTDAQLEGAKLLRKKAEGQQKATGLTKDVTERIAWQPAVQALAKEKGYLGEGDLLSKLTEKQYGELLAEAKMEAGVMRPVKTKSLEYVQTGEKTITEKVREKGQRAATPEELAERGTLEKELSSIENFRGQMIDSFIQDKYAPHFAEAGSFEGAKFPGALSNAALTTKEIRAALKNKKGPAWEKMRGAASRQMSEGYGLELKGKPQWIVSDVDDDFAKATGRADEIKQRLAQFSEEAPAAAKVKLPNKKLHLWNRGELEQTGYVPVFIRGGRRGTLPEGLTEAISAGQPIRVALDPGKLITAQRGNTPILTGWAHKDDLIRDALGAKIDANQIIMRGGIKPGVLNTLKQSEIQAATARALGSIPRNQITKPALPKSLQDIAAAEGKTPQAQVMLKYEQDVERARTVPITEKRYVEKVVFKQDPNAYTPFYFPHAFEKHMESNPYKFSQFYEQKGMPKEVKIPALFKRKGKEGYIVSGREKILQVFSENYATFRRLEAAELKADMIEQKFAKPYSGNLEDLLPGFVEWKYKEVLQHAKVGIVGQNEFLKQVGAIYGGAKAKGLKALEKIISEADLATMQKQAMLGTLKNPATRKMLIAFKNPNRMQVPKHVADEMANFAKPPNPWVYALWDVPTHAWKWSVLKLWPRWTYNDIAGSGIFNTIAGVNPKDYFDTTFNKKYKEIIPWESMAEGQSLVQSATKLRHPGSVVTDPLVGPLVEGAEALGESKVGRAVKTGLYPIEKVADFNGWLNMKVNQFMRAANYLHAAKKIAKAEVLKVNEAGVRKALTGQARSEAVFAELKKMRDSIKVWDPEIDEKIIDYWTEPMAKAALDHVNYFLNDWQTGLNAFERRVVTRVVPFYAWIKHVVNLTRKLPVDYPGRSEAIRALTLGVNELTQEEDAKYLPAWLKQTTKLSERTIQRPGEEPVIEQKRIRTSTVNPFNTFIEVREGLGNVHPLLQAIITALQQKDVRSGRPISTPGVTEEFVSGENVGYDPRTGRVELKDQKAPLLDILTGQLAESYPPLKYAGLAEAGGRVHDTSVPFLRSQPILDQRTGKPRFPNKWMDEFIRYFGPSVTTVEDVEGMIERRKAGRERGASRIFNRAIQNPTNLQKARQQAPGGATRRRSRRYGPVQNPMP